MPVIDQAANNFERIYQQSLPEEENICPTLRDEVKRLGKVKPLWYISDLGFKFSDYPVLLQEVCGLRRSNCPLLTILRRFVTL